MSNSNVTGLRLYRVVVELEFPVLAASPAEACDAAQRELDAIGTISDCARARLSAEEGYTCPADWRDDVSEYPVHVPRGDHRRLSWSQAVELDRAAASESTR